MLNNPKKVKRKPLTHEDIEEIRRLKSEGWANLDISKKFNRSRSYIHNIISGISGTSIEE